MNQDRRQFIKQTGFLFTGLSLYGLSACSGGSQNENSNNEVQEEQERTTELFFKISLAQWSLHRMLRAGELDPLDFASYAKTNFDIDAVEYVSRFYVDIIRERSGIAEWKKRVDDAGVQSLLIMVDDEGNLGDLDAAARQQAVTNHKKWLKAAKYMGCHSIRVNAAGQGEADEVAAAAAESLAALGDLAKPMGLNVLVENHGGYSSDGQWLSGVMQAVNKDNVGTLPDFGNFCIQKDESGKCVDKYDRYKGVKELMPFAKAVSAKSHDFDNDGNEVNTDYTQMLKLVKAQGYNGYVGIEYEGNTLSEYEGIIATKKLLEKAGRNI
jgi:sugar phosphate isomerase/epimerase